MTKEILCMQHGLNAVIQLKICCLEEQYGGNYKTSFKACFSIWMTVIVLLCSMILILGP